VIARFYRLEAAEDKAEELVRALEALAMGLRKIPGFEKAELLRDQDQSGRLIFIEKWASVQAHKDGAALLPKELMAPLKTLLAGPPEAAYLEYLIA
jgi:quinol monooxygenase YgiN